MTQVAVLLSGILGRSVVDRFARLFVIPQANHGLQARTADVDGAGKAVARVVLPTSYERFALLVDWVERQVAQGKSVMLTGGRVVFPVIGTYAY